MLTKEDLISKKEMMIKQLNITQQQLFQIQGAIMFVDQEIKKMEEKENGEKMAEDSGQENIHK